MDPSAGHSKPITTWLHQPNPGHCHLASSSSSPTCQSRAPLFRLTAGIPCSPSLECPALPCCPVQTPSSQTPWRGHSLPPSTPQRRDHDLFNCVTPTPGTEPDSRDGCRHIFDGWMDASLASPPLTDQGFVFIWNVQLARQALSITPSTATAPLLQAQSPCQPGAHNAPSFITLLPALGGHCASLSLLCPSRTPALSVQAGQRQAGRKLVTGQCGEWP